MWIRSQNKKSLGDYKEVVVISSSVLGYSNVSDDSTKLGDYETNERAVEILDKIQNQLTNISKVKESESASYDNSRWLKTEYSEIVFQMPDK